MDSDSTSRRGAYNRILTALDRGEIDILVGTQMITKGHDFPGVTLVGVVSADTSLKISRFPGGRKKPSDPDAGLGERREGRCAGQVIVQTMNPDNSAIQHARRRRLSRILP